MLRTLAEMRCCDEYLGSTAGTHERRTSAATSRQRQVVPIGPRVLVVEFRDEVFAGLKAVLDEHDCYVGRAQSGADVAGSLNRFMYDLVLVNESMPDESGWLITCKLRLTRHRQPVWLYAAQPPRSLATWKEYSGVNQVIEYGGVLFRLVRHVRQRLTEWVGSPVGEPSHGVSTSAPRWVA